MKAISIRCPECNASLRVAADRREADCAYCGTRAHILRRTGIFERAERPPPGHSRSLPVATQRHTGAWVLTLTAIPVLIIGIAVPLALQARNATTGTSTSGVPPAGDQAPSPPPPPPPPPDWKSQGVALVDVTGDGALDPVGLIHDRATTTDYLASYDGTTGALVWSTEISLKSGDTPVLAIAEGTVVLAPTETQLRGFSLADGTKLWDLSLPERRGMVCRGDAPGAIAVQTRDRLWHAIQLADGAIAPLAWLGPCRSLDGDTPYVSRAGLLHVDEPFQYPMLALDSGDMRADSALFDMDRRIAIALAVKQPGTAVPMLVRYEYGALDARIEDGDFRALRLEFPQDKRKEIERRIAAAQRKIPKAKAVVLWSATVPDSDPLEANEGPLPHRNVALRGDALVVSYTGAGDTQHLAAFDISDGTRRWDIPLPGTGWLSQVSASATLAFVVRGARVVAYRLDDGSEAFSLP